MGGSSLIASHGIPKVFSRRLPLISRVANVQLSTSLHLKLRPESDVIVEGKTSGLLALWVDLHHRPIALTFG